MSYRQFFSLISLVIVATYGLPTKNLDDGQNAIVSINANDNVSEDHGKTSEIRHPIAQSKPRILVSYGNVYKQTPVDPMQNLLMYFLMNVARDFAQEQDQFERRRSPGFFSDAKSTITDVTGKIVNGSKKVGQKVGDTFKGIASREIPMESQYEEAHYYPHIDGTCMCFNRLVRHGQPDIKNNDGKKNLVSEKLEKDSNESSTEKKAKEVTDGQLKNDKTTESKMENHNVPDGKEKSTIAVKNEVPVKENNTGVRVLKVFDLDHLETGKTSAETTIVPKEQVAHKMQVGDDLIVDLKTVPQESLKRSSPMGTCRPPPKPDNPEMLKRDMLNGNKNKSNEDDGYYFLSSSGGTDKRTTATEIKHRELRHYENLMPRYDRLQHLLEAKRRRRRRSKRHHNYMGPRKLSPIDDRSHRRAKLEILQDNFRKRRENFGKGEKDVSLGDDKFLPSDQGLVGPDVSFLMLPNSFQGENQKIEYRKADIPKPPSQQKMLLTVTLPTIVGGGLVLIVLCYFLRAKGWCCQLFMDKSNIVVVDANEDNKKKNTTS